MGKSTDFSKRAIREMMRDSDNGRKVKTVRRDSRKANTKRDSFAEAYVGTFTFANGE